MRSVRVSSRVTPEVKKSLEAAANKMQRTESQIMEIALKRYLDDPKTKEGGE